MERQRIDSVVGRLKCNQKGDSQQSKSQIDEFHGTSRELPVSTCINNSREITYSYPNLFIPPPGISTPGVPSSSFIPQLTPVRNIMNVPPMQPNGAMYLNLAMPRSLPICTVLPPLNAQVLTPPLPQHMLTIQGNRARIQSQEFANINNNRSVIRSSPLEHVMQTACIPVEIPLAPHVNVAPIQFQNPTVAPHVNVAPIQFQNPAVDGTHLPATSMHIPPFSQKHVKTSKATAVKGCKDSTHAVEVEATKGNGMTFCC